MGLRENFRTTLLLLLLLLSVLIFPATSIAQHQNLFPSLLLNQTLFSYTSNNFVPPEGYQFFSTSGGASIQNNGVFQITPNYFSKNFTMFNNSGKVMFRRSFKFWSTKGKVMFRRSFKFWSTKDDTVLSFSSTFLINVFPAPTQSDSSKSIPGEGLAFVISPDLETPPGSSGGFLGLTNRTHDGYPSNKFIAIELDTVKEDENGDPNDNHMGLNINSVRSIKTVNLSEHNIEIAPINYTLWIQYSGISMLLDVYMAQEGNPKPNTPLLGLKLNLKEHLNQYSYFGFSASTGDTAQLNAVLSWNLTVEILPEEEAERKSDKRWLTILWRVCIPAAAVICVVCFCIWVWKLYREGHILEALDPRLGSDYEAEEAQRLLLFGLACSHPIASERPKTQTIIQIISGSIPLPLIPVFKPSFFLPSLEPNTDDDENTQCETPLTSSILGI